MPLWLSTILPIIGIVIGASLQFFFSRKSNIIKDLQKLKIQAYIDYCKAIAERKYAKTHDDKSLELKSIINQTDSKIRIALYGSSNAIKALYEFEKNKAILNNQHSIDIFIDMIKTFRHELKKDNLENQTFDMILFGEKKGIQ